MAAPEATRVTSPTNQPSGKPSMAGRISGKQDDDSQRRNQAAPKAWGSGVNPITQKFASSSQSNGIMNKGTGKPTSPDSPAGSEKAGNDSHATVLSQSLGQTCTLVTKEGTIYVGTLAAVKSKQAETLLLCRMVRSGSSTDLKAPQKNCPQKQFVGEGPEHVMVFPASQMASIIPSSLAKPSRAPAGKGFMTDAQISGNAAFRERNLEKWQAPAGTFSLGNTESTGEWDQFKVNEEKFGVKSDYHESHYTTVIDKSNPLYALRERRAAKLAAEIQSDASSNAYGEQRGTNDEGYDEEDLFSGVRRTPVSLPSGQPNAYVPPSRRAQQQQQQQAASSKEGLVDPAIISAQVARKDIGTKDAKPAQAADVAQKTTSVPAATPAGAVTATASAPTGDKAAAATSTTKKGPAEMPAAATVTSASTSTAAKPAQTPAPLHTQIGLGPSSRGLPDVRTAFKNFANLEKLKVQDNRRRQASHDKAVKVNDLKKFAQNFKLNTPVPKDLLPILAKSEIKQNEIVKKAQEQVELTKQAKTPAEQPKAAAASAAEAAPPSKKQAESAAPAQPAASQAAGAATGGAGQGVTGSPAQSPLSQRLDATRRMHKNQYATPQHSGNDQRARVGSSSHSVSNVTSPTRPNARPIPTGPEKKLNVGASVFVPNAKAASFTPGVSTTVSSPSTKNVSTRPITPNMPQPKFLREAKARDARGVKARPITARIQQAKTLKPREDKPADQTSAPSAATKSKEAGTSSSAGAVKLGPPFRERVDWLDNSQTGKEDELPSYKDAFNVKPPGGRNVSHPASPGMMGRGPHPGPYPMSNMHPMAPQMPMQMHPQPHYPQSGHFEDPHMRPSPQMGMQPYPVPSPRAGSVYPSPVPQAPMAFHQNGYMNPGPQHMPPRQYSNGPGGMPGPQMQPPMMLAQNSTGPYMQQHMMPMQHGHPYQAGQPMYPGPPQPNGFPSPGRAPPMMPSNSHSGPGPMYTPNGQYAAPVYHHHPGPMAPRGNFNGQPHYPQSPYQQHPYPARTPSHGYAQPHQTPMQQNQAPPPTGAAASAVKPADDAK